MNLGTGLEGGLSFAEEEGENTQEHPPVRIGRLEVRHIPRAQRFIPPDTFYTQN